MKASKMLVCFLVTSFVLSFSTPGYSQADEVQLPLQLVGIPALVLITRVARFFKQLGYIFNPATYKSRTRRDLAQSEQFDAAEVEKYIVNEFGTRACVFERICAHYAVRAHSQPRPEQLDWPDVFGQYKRSEDSAKEYYLLSVFLGDIVGSPQLCHQLGKRRPCDASMLGDE